MQGFIVFITLLSLIQIIILAQDITNLVVQFIKIILKILVSHLCDWVKSYLDDIRVKRSITMYNNKELALRIWQYIFKHIQNLDKV